MSRLRRIGLARIVRLLVMGTIPPLWLEIALLHFRGSFQSRFMWIPIAGLPVVLAGGAASEFLRDETAARKLFRPFAWLMAGIGVGGSLFHLRGVCRQMGGLQNWKYNVVTGPPVPAPVQVALFGLLAAFAASPSRPHETPRLVRTVRAVNAASCCLLTIEAGYNHWAGGYFNKLMYTPVLVGPTMVLVHLGALAQVRTARAMEAPVAAVAVAAGLVGMGFHVRNIRRRSGGFSWQNLFYGPPAVAPLQLTGEGILGLLPSLFDRRR